MIPVIALWNNGETFKDAVKIYLGGTMAFPIIFMYCNSVSVDYGILNPHHTKWLRENIWHYRYVRLNDEIIFLHDHDAMAFKLRWEE